MSSISRFLFFMVLLSVLLFLYIREQNEILTLRREIPSLEREIREIGEDNLILQYTVEQFLNPHHLLQLAQDPAYGHLHYPLQDEIIFYE